MDYKDLKIINNGNPSIELLEKALKEYSGEVNYYTKEADRRKQELKVIKKKLKIIKTWVVTLEEKIKEKQTTLS